MEEGGETAQSPMNGSQSCSQLCPSIPGSALAARLGPLGKLLWKTEGEGVKNPEQGTPELGKSWTASTGPYPAPRRRLHGTVCYSLLEMLLCVNSIFVFIC